MTLETLSKYNIPYHEIYFGKPHADIYIDDHAVNANLDTCKELGWQIQLPRLSDGNIDCQESAAKAGIVMARPFNSIQIVGDTVIKSSKSRQLLGEMVYYANLPEEYSDLFPTVFSMEYLAESETFSLTMQKISGITYSHLIESKAITRGRLHALLSALNRIHTSKPVDIKQTSLTEDIPEAISKLILQSRIDTNPADIYANYSTKLKERFENHISLYRSLDENIEQTFQTLQRFLIEYEKEQRGIQVAMIHGDPVFSNVLLVGGVDTTPQVKLIDVRGRLGSRLTSQGDALYDLSKVFQSLQGYDMILLKEDCPQDIDSFFSLQDLTRLSELQQYFWEFVETYYDERVILHDIVMITASHFFSLIPLHDPKRHSIFYNIAKRMIRNPSLFSYIQDEKEGLIIRRFLPMCPQVRNRE
ncbi:hypothetical protein ABW20_dc0109991 [Dactylellina cionopaga]|nr:hypothetical protein ABW20_dc0109991 [Dactylellina cionopaga]